MEEEHKQEKTIDTEELKKETVETVNQVKDTIKRVKFKEDTKETTGFLSALIKDPIRIMEDMVIDSENKYLKVAILFAIAWTILIFGAACFKVTRSIHTVLSIQLIARNVFVIIKATIAPVLIISVFSIIIFLVNKTQKRPLTVVATAVTVAMIPRILASFFTFLPLIFPNITPITNRISSVLGMTSSVLLFFAIRTICGEKEEAKGIKTFVLIGGIYAIVSLLCYYLGITI